MHTHSTPRNRDRSNRQRFSSAIAATVEPIEARIFLAANPIVLENQLPGTPQSEWDVAGAGDISLQGFATDISVNRGTTVSFKVDDASLAQYHIDIYRMGYYGGMGARHVATIPSSQTLRQVQQAPAPDPATGLVDCGNWNVSATWNVPSNATSGIYFAKLVREDNGGASHIMFIVRDDSSHSDLLFQTSDSTWEAYNNYGGGSLYEADGAAPGSEEAETGRAVAVSYNRPLTVRGTSGGLGDYNSPFHAEYPMVRWLESNGYDVSYFTDVDSARLGSEIRNHAVFMSVGHDEYWSGEQRANVEAARDAGVNLAFFSGNEIFWKTRWQDDVNGNPYRTLVTYKESKANAVIDPADPPIWTGTWRDMRFSPPADGGRPENALSGTAYMNDRTNVDIGIAMQVSAADGKLRFWRNTAVSNQSAGQVATIGDRVVGYETDEDLDNGFRPAGLMDMSSTTFTTNAHVVVPWGSEVAPGSSTHKITLYRAPSGALVFGAGTVQWSWGLDGQHDDGVGTADPNIQQATVNLLADMSVQPTTLQAGLLPAVASTDVTGPVTTITLPANNANLQANSSVTISGTAADSGGGIVGGVEVSVDGGKTWHPATGRGTWSYSWIPVVSGPIKVLARASDDSGNLGASATTNVTVALAATSSSNLVAAYNFNAGSGTTLADASGHGNTGTIANATWTSLGRYGNALSFNGVDSMVTVADSNILDLTTGMTLEAWVKPTSFNGWENVLLKERTGGLVYSLYASDDVNSSPTTDIRTGSGDYVAQRGQSVQLNQWTHLASTFDGTSLRLYVNGNLVSSTDVNGSMAASTGALRIGADSVFGGENFQGLIDDIRIYNRALSATELSADLSTPIGGTIDATAPTGSISAPGNGSNVAGNVTLTANASDNAAVAGVTFLLNGNPISGELSADPGLPYTFQWNSTSVANGSYTLAARIRDVAGNVTTTSGVAITVNNAADTILPTITLTSPTGGAATGTPVLNAVASDDIRLAGVQFKVNGANLGPEITSAPFRQPWNTASLTTGTYTLTAVARDAAGNLTTSSAVQVTVDNSPPQITGESPTSSATNVATSAVFSATFSKPVQPGTISFVVKDSTNHVISGAVSYFNPTNTVFFTPDLTLSPSAAYTATVSGATDNAGVVMTAPVTWSFTTRSQVTDATIFRNQVPSNTSANDSNAIEVGVKFRVDMSGTITGIRFYRGINNTGQHTGHLWKSDGTLLGTVTFTDESGTGWQLANFSTPIAVTPGVTYVASYYAPNGRYSADNGTFATSGIDNAPLHALANGDDGAQGVYLYASGGGFPTSPGLGSNYWVDVLFTSAIDTTAPTVSSSDPATSATGVSTASSIQATFSEQVQSGTISFILKDNQGNTIPAEVSYSAASQTATLTPTASLSTSTTYTATISGVKDLSGNLMSAPFSWSFTTAATSTFTLWSKTSAPVVASASDAASIEVGLKFRASVDGTISGIRFYKGAGNTGAHIGHLWSSTGQLVASVTFTNESATGWQVATLSSPVSIQANIIYVVSYTAPNGHYAADGGTFASSGVDSGPLHALASPTAGGNGIYLYGGGFPTNSFNATNYWVDVLFQQIVADTTPPSITSRTPAAGAVEVSRTTSVSATFSEAIQPAGVVVTLTDVNGASVSGTTSYDSNTQTITFIPSATLDVAGNYTASISGVKDLSDNAMATATWSFTTSSAAIQTPAGITVWPNTTTPALASANDNSSLELGLKFRTDLNGTVTGIRFYKGAGNTGTHVGHLWDANGNLLASVTFTNETATGWQTAAFSTPVAISANSVYVISYYAPAGHYAADSGYFTTTGVNNGALHALANGVSGPNGVFIATAGGAFPTNSFGAANYWVDLYFSANTDQIPPVISSIASSSSTPTSAVVTWSTDEPADSQVQYGTTPSYGSTTALDATLVTSHSVPLSDLNASTLYHYRIVTRDAAGNQAVSADFTFITGAASYSVWDNSAAPAVASVNDPNAVEVGTKIRVDMNGVITGIRFYKGAGNIGTHVGHLWDGNGNLLASVTFTNETASGWQTATFSTPVSVTAGVTYVISYYAPNGGYAATSGYFTSSGAGSGPVHALASGVDGADGLYRYGSGGGFPTNSYNNSNYWVDVVFQPSLDTTAPTVASSTPASGATNVGTSSAVTVTFSEGIVESTLSLVLKDSGGNTVASTVSYDAASKTATLTPTSALSSLATYTVTVSGATDVAGNTMSSVSWSFTTQSIVYSVWDNSAAPAVASASDSSSVELGMKFRADVDGLVSGVRFFKGVANSGIHVGHLWDSGGNLLATVNFSDESSSGWQQANFSAPISITAGQTYIVSYYAPNGGYAYSSAYFASSGAGTGPVHALASGVDGANGLYRYGSGGGFPNSTYNNTNYWVDVVFQPSLDTTAPTVASSTPASGATNVGTSSAVTVTFSEGIVESTLSLVLKDSGGNTVASTVSYDAASKTATLTPTSALSSLATYTVTVSGATDVAGNTMSSVSWSFTTAAASYSVWDNSAAPAVASVNDPNAVEVGTKIRVDMNGVVTGIRFYKGAGNIGTHVGHLWDGNGNLLASVTFTNETASGWQTATFSTPVSVTAGVTYVISYYAPNGGYAATSGYFTSSGAGSGPVHALASGVDGADGLYRYGSGGGFPTNSYNNSNYWVDVVFQPTP